jgi:hypothetical protein
MPAVTGSDTLPRDESKPQKKREGRLAEKLLDPAGRLQLTFLNNVGRIQTTRQAGIQAYRNHPRQPGPMPGKKLAQAFGVPLSHLA